MMLLSTVPVKELHRGFRRGVYECTVKNVLELQSDEEVESNMFEIGGFKWKLALFRGFRNGRPPELIRIFLFSCNAQGVYSDVSLRIVGQTNTERHLPERKPKVAIPFNSIDRLNVPIEQLRGLHQMSEGALTVTVDLKNIREATVDEQRATRCNMRTIHLEVIDDESIRDWLNPKAAFDIVSPTRKRNSDVFSYSLVRLWAQQNPDHRYWLCERTNDGRLLIKTCLNHLRILQSFEDICDDSGGGFPWVTVFKEEKKSNETFRQIEDGNVFVFFMSHEEPQRDSSCLGHLIVPRSMPFRDLSTKAAAELAHFEKDKKFQALLCQATGGWKDIVDENSSLAESDFHSASVIVLKPEGFERRVASKPEEIPPGDSSDLCADADSVPNLQINQHCAGKASHTAIVLQREKNLKEIEAKHVANVRHAVKEPNMAEIKQFGNIVDCPGKAFHASSQESYPSNTVTKDIAGQFKSDSDAHIRLSEGNNKPRMITDNTPAKGPKLVMDHKTETEPVQEIVKEFKQRVLGNRDTNSATDQTDFKKDCGVMHTGSNSKSKFADSIQNSINEADDCWMPAPKTSQNPDLREAYKCAMEEIGEELKVAKKRETERTAGFEMPCLSARAGETGGHQALPPGFQLPRCCKPSSKNHPEIGIEDTTTRQVVERSSQTLLINKKESEELVLPEKTSGLSLRKARIDVWQPSETHKGKHLDSNGPSDGQQEVGINQLHEETNDSQPSSSQAEISIARKEDQSFGDSFGLVTQPQDYVELRHVQNYLQRCMEAKGKYSQDHTYEAVDRVEQTFLEEQEEIAQDFCKGIKRPMVEEIHEVKQMVAAMRDVMVEAMRDVMVEAMRDVMVEAMRDVMVEAMRDVKQMVEVSHKVKQMAEAVKEVTDDMHSFRQENAALHRKRPGVILVADLKIERLLDKEDAQLALKDRRGKEAPQVPINSVKDETVSLLDRCTDYRMRLWLAHKRQDGNCKMNCRVRYISVKPLDGIGIGLRVFETKMLSDGIEVVALFQLDWLQSPRLSSICPQSVPIKERCVSVSVTIGIEHMDDESRKLVSQFELKELLWCLKQTEVVHNATGLLGKLGWFTRNTALPWTRNFALAFVVGGTLKVAGCIVSKEQN